MSSDGDERWMDAALALASAGLGRVWPNPSVGCVLVRDGALVGSGRTADGGRPHAETEALANAGTAARGATAYVTLEPCSHWGKTPPCADALIAAGVARVVVALEDPDPRVHGAGLRRLVDAGIALTLGVRAAEAALLNAGFFSRIRTGEPLLAVVEPAELARWDALLLSDDMEAPATTPGLLLRLSIDGAAATLTFSDGEHAPVFFPTFVPETLRRALGERGLTRVAALATDPIAPMVLP